MRRWSRAGARLGAAALATCGLSACSSGPDPSPAASAFLSAWSTSNFHRAAQLTDHPATAESALRSTAQGLHVVGQSFQLRATVRRGDRATASYRAVLSMSGLGRWSYSGRLGLRLGKADWKVAWSPSDLYPTLRSGQELTRTRSLAPRAPILAADGSVLVGPQPVVTVGLVRALVTDVPGTLSVLARATGIDPARISRLLGAAAPDAFVPVITLRRADYEKAKPSIYTLPGVRFLTGTADLAPTSTFGLAVLGRVGPATADALGRIGAPYLGADDVGLSGLELAYQRQLAGAPSGSVEISDRSGRARATLDSFPGQAGRPLRTTLNPRMQAAAEAALAGTALPSALVAVRASTSEVLAVADGPTGSSYDRALEGEYPPGSSFKVVTTTALLGVGITPATSVPCPPRTVVDGKPFTNFEGEAPGAVSFATDFAISCNTAFVDEASSKLAPPDLSDAAAAFGFGAHWKLPLPAYSGQMPPPKDGAELAADAIGQGRVLASPLNMALVAGAVDSGSLRPPILIAGSPPEPAGPPLSPAVDGTLKALMRQVVTAGTGTAANLAGPPIFAKTGTAEFGSAIPPRTHAWFIAFRGDVAVAVLVEGGGVGGKVAAPLAARFFSSLGP